MSCHPRVTEWTTILQAHLPHLTQPHATVLALWSLGMVLARACALTAVRAFLAPWLGRTEPTVRQQVRALCYEATAKRGTARGARAVEPCVVPRLAWGVGQWEGTPWALALEATTVGTRFTVLARSVGYRGCAIPVAWTVLTATANHAGRREWWRLRRQVHRALPRSWTVLVLADRGLDARWLLRRITRLGWHPFVRSNTGGTLRPTGPGRGGPLKTLGPAPGTTWQGTGIAFKGRHRQRHCTPAGLLGGRGEGPVVAPDGRAAGGQYRLLVWGAGLDCAGLQEHPTRRLAVAAHPQDQARAGRAPVAGRRRGDLVAAERRGRGGRDGPGQHGPRRHRLGPRTAADAACHSPAPGEWLSPGLAPAPGGLA